MLQVEKSGKSQIKSRNRVKVFGEILKQGRISRKQLERTLGLSAPSVTRVVEDLLKEGLIYEEGLEQTYVGRRPILLCVRKKAYYSLGMNLSRTSLYYCVENLGGEILYSDRMELRKISSGDDIMEAVDAAVAAGLCHTGVRKEQLIGIGVASRGTVDEEKGSVIYSPELEAAMVKDHLREQFDCGILVENNVVADLKVQYLDADSPNQNLVYLYISDGVGGSILCDGEVVNGEHSMAGKFAHIPVEAGGRECTCGKQGHLEAYVSAPALEREYQSRAGAAGQALTLMQICELANRGDGTARQVLDAALDKLALGVYQILVILNPGTLVFYGDLFEYYDGVLEQLREKTTALAFSEEITRIRWMVREKKSVRIEDSIARLAVENALEIIG